MVPPPYEPLLPGHSISASKNSHRDVGRGWWFWSKASKCALERELTRAVVPRSLDRVFGSGVQGVKPEAAKGAIVGVHTSVMVQVLITGHSYRHLPPRRGVERQRWVIHELITPPHNGRENGLT